MQGSGVQRVEGLELRVYVCVCVCVCNDLSVIMTDDHRGCTGEICLGIVRSRSQEPPRVFVEASGP